MIRIMENLFLHIAMQHEFELGQYIRKRYNALLPTNIYPNKLVYVRSTGGVH